MRRCRSHCFDQSDRRRLANIVLLRLAKASWGSSHDGLEYSDRIFHIEPAKYRTEVLP